MASRRFGLSVVCVILMTFVCTCGAVAATLASGEYAVTNGSFEDGTSMPVDGWRVWMSPNSINVNTDSSQAYYGTNSASMCRETGDIILYQDITVVDAGNDGPHAGETAEAGAWIMFSPTAAGNSGQIVLEVKYVIGETVSTMATSSDIDSREAGKWYYLMTESSTASAIPASADAIQISITSHVNGTVYVDFVQAGLVGSITGNPSKLALAEYHTWFGVPDYLPDSRRYTDPDYDGFSSYDPSGWEHWEWHWDSQSEYNNDPGFYEQIGFRDGRKYTSLPNTGFEDAGYGTGGDDWSKYAPSGSTNIRTDEKAYEGSYSVKFINNSAGTEECSMWQSITDVGGASEPSAPNDKEQIVATAMVNFADVNFANGKFWMQVTAFYDLDPGAGVNIVNHVIAKSYEYVSPEYVDQNKDANGWVQIKTRPVEKAVIPDGTVELQVAIKFYYGGTIYIDKVEIGEAEYSNVQRQTACAKHPKPRIGPYDSTNDDLIDYHLELCKAMLFDVMLVDYYGHQYGKEDYQRTAFGKLVQEADDKDMKVCAFYEPKLHLLEWGDLPYVISNINELDANETATVNAYIDDVTVYNDITEISDVNDVMHYIKMAAIQDDIEYILTNWSGEKSYLAYRGKPVVAIFGLSITEEKGMEQQDWTDIYDNLTVHDGSYDFIFIGDATPGDSDLSGWYDMFTGMMNWHLVGEDIMDKASPTQQDVFERSRDVINGRAVNWADDGQGRFTVGLTYPQFDNLGVGGWLPIFEYGSWNYYIHRTMSWEGDFYTKTNQGLMEHSSDIDWVVVATFNDWNEGTAVEPSIEDGYLYSILTQEFLEDFKGISDEPNDMMEQITEKYINVEINMDVKTNIEKAEMDSTGYETYYRLSVYQFDSSGGYLGELMLLDYSTTTGTVTDNFAGHHANLAQYEPSIRISATSGGGWIKVNQLSEGGWTEDFSDVSDWSGFEGATITSDGALATIKRSVDCYGGAQWKGARVPYTSGDIISLDIDSVYDGVGSGIYYSGAACLETVLDYQGFNTYTQDELHTYAVSQNISTDANTIDPSGMYLALNHFEIDSSYNYSAYKNTSANDAYDTICYWMCYDILGVLPRPDKMPAVIPLNGGYTDWVVVNGYSASDNPQTASSYTVNGFWITDPDDDGLGKNTYITAAALGSYYLPIDSSDSYDGDYVSVVEPPLSQASVTIAEPKAYKNYSGTKASIIAAAINGVEDNGLKENNRFSSAFSQTKAGKPTFVNNDGDSYYIVPFVKDDGCSVAVIVDAANGAFVQATYTEEPDREYLKHSDKTQGPRMKTRSKRKSSLKCAGIKKRSKIRKAFFPEAK
jgi:hypothetical protein